MRSREQSHSFSIGHMPDRRASPRAAIRLPVRVTINPPPGRETETVRFAHVLAQDVSGSGICLIYTTQLCVGQKIDVEMPDRTRSTTVCRSERMADGFYLIGCQFTD